MKAAITPLVAVRMPPAVMATLWSETPQTIRAAPKIDETTPAIAAALWLPASGFVEGCGASKVPPG
jgi:hypothetical protein